MADDDVVNRPPTETAVSKSASMIGVANLVIWPSLYERQRRIILAAGTIDVTAASGARAKSSTSSPII
jgi:hypothetical protein